MGSTACESVVIYQRADMARILVVDDDDNSLNTITLLLDGRVPAEIEPCKSPLAALKRIVLTDFAAIISDVKMPTMDGLTLLKEIRAKRPNTPVILTTAYEEGEVLLRAIRAGAYDYIKKPFDVDYLAASVTRAIQHAESLREIEAKQDALAKRALELEKEVELRERHRMLIENVLDYGMFTLDLDGRVTSWNIGAQRIKGYQAHEIIGKHFSTFYLRGDIDAGKPDMELVTAAAQGRVEDEGWRVRKDGSKFWANVVITALKDRNGNLRGYGKVTRDLTDRKNAEDSKEKFLREQSGRLTAEAMNKAKDQFFATLSHELRSPLTPMLGWTKILLSGSVDPSRLAFGLEVIQRNVKAQAKLIEDILDVSRIITGKFSIDVRRVELRNIIENAVEVVRPSAAAKNINLTTSLPEEPVELSGDGDRLQQIVWNLLTNAVKFTPKEGSIQIRLTRTESEAEISVSDTGIGLKPDFLPHIFERFSQADSSSVKVHGGLGIGLSLVKNLVELHHGTVRAESEGEGKGTTLTVKLPIAAAGENQSSTAPKQPDASNKPNTTDQSKQIEVPNTQARLQDVHVLVVDDEADARDLIAFVLQQSGAQVISAASSQDALECFQAKRPDVIVSDIAMPLEDGFAFIANIRKVESETGGHTPAIALTAYAQDADRNRCLSMGFQMHIAKPIDPPGLVSAVVSVLQQ